MADFIITHRIEAPELAAALNNLADALKARSVAVPAVQDVVVHPASETPAQAPAASPTPVQESAPAPAAAPVTATVNGGAPVATNAPAPAPVAAQAPVTAATSEVQPQAKTYTFDDITAAGSQLLELGKMNQLMELLKGYGVQAVTQLKPEQYADVAAGLRGLGAKI